MYNSVLDAKIDGNNKKAFCDRLISLLLDFYNTQSLERLNNCLNNLILPVSFNQGFAKYYDMLENAGYKSIIKLNYVKKDYIELNDILANIEVIINCFFEMNEVESNKKVIIDLIFKSCEKFISANGFKFKDGSDGKYRITQKDLPINIDDLENITEKDDILNYYNFSNTKNIHLKKMILTNLAIELDGKRKKICQVFGKNMDNSFFNYANNIEIRHKNTAIESSNYNGSIANLTEEELINWYDYIYSLALIINNNIDKLKIINVSSGCK